MFVQHSQNIDVIASFGRLIVPVGVGLDGGFPSLPVLDGSIALNEGDDSLYYVGGNVWKPVGGGGGGSTITLDAVGSNPNVNGATLVGQVLNLEPANANFPGVVNTIAQTFSGAKTFANTANFLDTTSSTIGLITKNGSSWIHNYGTSNTFMGVGSGNFTLSSIQNTGCGVDTLSSLTSGNNNCAFGESALHFTTSGRSNIAIGESSLYKNTTGNFNISIGDNTLFSNTTLSNLIAIGANALTNNITGIQNVAIGTNAMQNCYDGRFNTACGYDTLQFTDGNNNTAFGRAALGTNDVGNDNTAIGQNALVGCAGVSGLTAVGSDAFQANLTGTHGVAIGYRSMFNSFAGNNNTSVGYMSMFANTTGSNNTALGNNTLTSCTIGSDIVAIGSNTGGTLTNGTNCNYIGSGVGAAAAGESNTTKISQIRGITTVNNDAVAVVIDSAGQLGTISSTRSKKTDIHPLDDTTDIISQLKPSSFKFKCHCYTDCAVKGSCINEISLDKESSDFKECSKECPTRCKCLDEDQKTVGLIYDEVEQILPKICVKDSNGDPHSVQYHLLPIYLLRSMQEQIKEIKALKEEIKLLKGL